MALYTEDGVFMPPNNQSAVGKPSLRQAYDAVFKAITLNVRLINATDKISPEGNQELFIFRKGTDEKWRIARYSFSTTNPLLTA